MRGLVVAGIMATAMGSLSTALNALGTSFARDFVLPRKEAHGPISEEARVRVLRWSTVLFAALIILVGLATAYYMAHNPSAAIIPLVLGILGFTFGSLLGIFLVAVGTRTRGSDWGNVIAMFAGFAAVIFFSNGQLQTLVGFTTRAADGTITPALVLAFPWRITLGTFVTIAVSLCFSTSNAARATMVAKDATHP
jgi:Na+/proline symporter